MPFPVPVGQSPGRTDINTGAAEFTICFRMWFMKSGADSRVLAAVKKSNSACPMYFFTYSGASAAQHAKTVVPVHKRIIALYINVFIYDR